MTYRNANLLTFALSFCIFICTFCMDLFIDWILGFGIQATRLPRPDLSGARNDMRDYRTFPRASEANMPPKQRIAKTMNDALMLAWKRG